MALKVPAHNYTVREQSALKALAAIAKAHPDVKTFTNVGFRAWDDPRNHWWRKVAEANGWDWRIVEVDPSTAEHIRKNAPDADVTCADVLDTAAWKDTDILLFWHGPEHIGCVKFLQALPAIEAKARCGLVFGMPHGPEQQGGFHAHRDAKTGTVTPVRVTLSARHDSSSPNDAEVHCSAWIAEDWAQLGWAVDEVYDYLLGDPAMPSHFVAHLTVHRVQPERAPYWEGRYARGGKSGLGSTGTMLKYKARVLSAFVAKHDVQSVLELGCGDGDQIAAIDYPAYVGFDVSQTAVNLCRDRFADDDSKRFALVEDYGGETAELAVSLDVIYHLINDADYEAHMHMLFSVAARFVVIYSTDYAQVVGGASHVLHRAFSSWIEEHAPDWIRLWQPQEGAAATALQCPPGEAADFYVYARLGG